MSSVAGCLLAAEVDSKIVMDASDNQPGPQLAEWVIEPRREDLMSRLRDVWRYRRLMRFFATKSLEKMIRRTVLGPIWLLIRPLFPIFVNTFIFGGVLGVGSDGVPYFLFVTTGSAIWELFSAATMWGTRSLDLNRGLMNRIYIPRLILPLATMTPAYLNFVIYMVVLAVGFVYPLLLERHGARIDAMIAVLAQEFRALDVEVADTLRALKQASQDERPRLLDTTMLYAPRSGGVKRYLLSKKAWIEANRPGVSHSLIVPGARHRARADGIVQLRATRLPFGDGYRWPSSVKRWSAWVAAMKPSIIEAGDPYTPGQGALEAGQRVGCPVVGFCHSDPAGLAALHFGELAKKPVEKRWARLFSQFDRVVSPSRFIARRLEEAGVDNIVIRPLGVEVDTFRPDRRDRSWLLKELGLGPHARLLCFAGRPAKEKNVDVLIEAVQKLGAPYHLVLVGAGSGMPAEDLVISLPY